MFEGTTKAAIQIRVDIAAKGAGQITRDGVEVQQQVRRLRVPDIKTGALLVHRVDGRRFSVKNFDGTAADIESSDGTVTHATTEQVCGFFWLVEETSHSGSG